MIHSFILTREHNNFLREERKDPITQDSFELGNEVVFCADCKSAYLKDVWLLYKGCCEQNSTLSAFPTAKPLHLGKKPISNYSDLPSGTTTPYRYFQNLYLDNPRLRYSGTADLPTTQERQEEERLREKRVRAEKIMKFVINFIRRGVKISFILIWIIWIISLFTG